MSRVSHFLPKDVQTNTRLYNLYHNEYHMEDGWHPGNKVANYHSMLRLTQLTNISLQGTACLDVGCGSGDFSLFLRERGAKHYVGIDIYAPSFERAREKYPNEQFILGDILASNITEKFDYVFCSGALTVKLSIDNYDFLESMVAKMWELARVGLVFNVLTDDDPTPDNDLFFYNINRVIAICKQIAPEGKILSENTKNVFQTHFYLYR